MSNYEIDPTKILNCYVSFDPAIDDDTMGRDYDKHFGKVGDSASGRYGNRDPHLVKLHPGKRATVFKLRPLRVVERAACDALPTAESRWLRALAYSFVGAELGSELCGLAETFHPVAGAVGLNDDAMDLLGERVGIETLYEIGAVAYNRSKIGPFAQGFAPLPVTSALVRIRQLQHLADTLGPVRSDTRTTSGESASQGVMPDQSGAPGPVTAEESRRHHSDESHQTVASASPPSGSQTT